MAKIKSYIHIALLLCIGLALGSCTKWNYHDGGVAYGVHDCSMWDYFKKQPRDWDSTRVMIQHAGLQDLFEGKGEYGQITFLAPSNLAIMTYMFNNNFRRVNEIPAAECRRLLETHPDERRTPWFPFRGYRREDRRQDLHPDGRK